MGKVIMEHPMENENEYLRAEVTRLNALVNDLSKTIRDRTNRTLRKCFARKARRRAMYDLPVIVRDNAKEVWMSLDVSVQCVIAAMATAIAMLILIQAGLQLWYMWIMA